MTTEQSTKSVRIVIDVNGVPSDVETETVGRTIFFPGANHINGTKWGTSVSVHLVSASEVTDASDPRGTIEVGEFRRWHNSDDGAFKVISVGSLGVGVSHIAGSDEVDRVFPVDTILLFSAVI
jgi:hypothetical protein